MYPYDARIVGLTDMQLRFDEICAEEDGLMEQEAMERMMREREIASQQSQSGAGGRSVGIAIPDDAKAAVERFRQQT